MIGIAGNIALHLAIMALAASFFFVILGKNLKAAHLCFKIHGTAIVITITLLYILIFTHRFEYFYIWDHTATNMPPLYLFSSLWEGQEGSYLLWIFFNFLVGVLVFRKLSSKNSFGFLIFMGVQCFLLFMISGVSIGNIRVGTSPFRLVADEFPNDPIYLQNPAFIPAEGSGLNPLLQNSWMAIHPPIIFLGFAIALVPFCLYLNGLYNNNIKIYIKKALPWSLATTMVLLTGIIMGAYWAYETLNFGGYWSWDPVENAIYMPWLLSVAALHLQLVTYKSGKGLKTTTLITLFTFCMVLYSTFLTRSGILGDSSVHAFTDLGTSPILIAFLLLTIGISLLLPLIKKRFLTSKNIFDGTWNRATFIGLAAIIIILATFQVFLTTSIPVFNSIALLMGIDLNLTAPLEPISFYNHGQATLVTIILLASALAILSSWKSTFKLDSNIIYALIISLFFGFIAHYVLKPSLLYTFFIISLSFVSTANLINWLKCVKTKEAYHHLTHLGFYILLGGIIISGTSEQVMTHNNILGEGQENLLLVREQITPTKSGYNYQYLGKYRKTTSGEFIEVDKLAETSAPEAFLYLENNQNTKLVNIEDHHFYYKIMMDNGKETSIHFPTILKSPQGDIIVHPEITHSFTHDYFMHLTNFSSLDPSTLSWKEDTIVVLHPTESFHYKGHQITFNSISKEAPVNGISLNDEDIALRAKMKIDNNDVVAPKFIIKNDLAYMLPGYNASTGINIKLKDIDVDTGAYTFKIGKSGMDWLTLKVVKKPFLSLIWIGSFIMFAGLALTISKRITATQKTLIHPIKPLLWNSLSGTLWIKKLRKNEV